MEHMVQQQPTIPERPSPVLSPALNTTYSTQSLRKRLPAADSNQSVARQPVVSEKVSVGKGYMGPCNNKGRDKEHNAHLRTRPTGGHTVVVKKKQIRPPKGQETSTTSSKASREKGPRSVQ